MRLHEKQISVVLLAVCFYCTDLLASEYKVAVRALRGLDAAIIQWQPTLDYLSKKIPKHKFILVPILSLSEITVKSGRGDFDFVLTNPSSYVEIKTLHEAQILATLNNKRANTAQDEFGTVIFTHANNETIFSIKDLKNKTVMAVSEHAFGGWRVAWLEMLNNNFDPYKNLKELRFTKNKTQPEVVFAVLNGEIDVGIVRTDLLERMEAAEKIDMRYFRVINNKDVKGFPFFLSTPLYPEWAFSALKHVPVNESEKVRKALFSITQTNNAAVIGKYIGWIPPRDYSAVQALMKNLKVGPYEKLHD